CGGPQREGSLIVRRGTRVPSQPKTATSWPTQRPPDQTSSISRGSSGLSLSASSSHSGHRWQCLWGQQLRLSPLANTEPLRLRHLALCKDCRIGVSGMSQSLRDAALSGLVCACLPGHLRPHPGGLWSLHLLLRAWPAGGAQVAHAAPPGGP
ncbi:mCG20394, isoform CRA_b, partial [Mus musculus]